MSSLLSVSKGDSKHSFPTVNRSFVSVTLYILCKKQIVKNHLNVKADSNDVTSLKAPMTETKLSVIVPAVTALKRLRCSHDEALIINGKEYLDDAYSKVSADASTKPNARSNVISRSAVIAVKEMVKKPGQDLFNHITDDSEPKNRETEKFLGDKENKANEMEKRESYDRWRRKILEKR